MIVALTCTGGRQIPFDHCVRYVERQEVPVDLWVIVDDCEPRTEINTSVPYNVIHPEPSWESDGPVTLTRNFMAGLELIQDLGIDGHDDKIIVFEDDDWYSPAWTGVVSEVMDSAPDKDLFGEGFTVYYHVVVNHWYQNMNDQHASLCGTAFRASMIDDLMDLLHGQMDNPFIDHTIWMTFPERGLILSSNHVIGIKGLPGRGGAGMAHDANRILRSWPNNDWDLKSLADLVGTLDADVYKAFSESNVPEDDEIRRLLESCRPDPRCGMPPNMMAERKRVIDKLIRERNAKKRGAENV